MSFERARAHLAGHGLADRIIETSTSSATVELAAAALGTQPERIAKTLSFLVDGDAVLVVAAGDSRVDNAAFKQEFGTKARMIPGADVEALVGHAPGGVCPFGVESGVRVYLDESLCRFDTVYPACGDASSGVPLSNEELERAAAPVGWVRVTRVPAAD